MTCVIMKLLVLLALCCMCYAEDARGDNDGGTVTTTKKPTFADKLGLPGFVKNAQKLVQDLLDLCEKNAKSSESQQGPKDRINLGNITFQNCTYVCQPKNNPSMELHLPKGTPCAIGKHCTETAECQTSLPEGC
uniref:Secreted salivary protein Salp15 n=1 Tax=Ixodes holocyclus TaxID=65647 RepID=A0A1S5R0T4_IXOHO|nr:secreted salivary protein Salp15 [Ixodes holocyclus]